MPDVWPALSRRVEEDKGGLLTKLELAREIGRSTGHIEVLRAQGLPYARVDSGRRLLYDLSVCETWLDDHYGVSWRPDERGRRERERRERHAAKARATACSSRTDRRRIALAPFLQWLEEYAASYRRKHPGEREQGGLPLRVVAEIGWDTKSGWRRLWRYRDSEQLNGSVAVIEDALERVGVWLWEVYPEFGGCDPIDRWCVGCNEMVMTDETLVCPWCESDTTQGVARCAA